MQLYFAPDLLVLCAILHDLYVGEKDKIELGMNRTCVCGYAFNHFPSILAVVKYHVVLAQNMHIGSSSWSSLGLWLPPVTCESHGDPMKSEKTNQAASCSSEVINFTALY